MPEHERRIQFFIGQGHWIEATAYSLFAVILIGTILYLSYLDPVLYSFLVAEDHLGEYATALQSGLAGTLFLFLFVKLGCPLCKLPWVFIGVTCLFMAGEEISWGQRIFHFATPDFFYRFNVQEELNVHNLLPLHSLMDHQGVLRKATGVLMLGWALFSLSVAGFTPRLAARIEHLGLPLVPLRLLFVFLLAPLFFLLDPVVKADEVGELFFSVAIAALAMDLCFRHLRRKALPNARAMLYMIGSFLSIALAALALTLTLPGSRKSCLHAMAALGYSRLGMYEQAEKIYRHIYANPGLIKPETRINHARMLMEWGRERRAKSVLIEALADLGKGPESSDSRGEYLLRKGIIYSLLGQRDVADTFFEKAITKGRKEAELFSDPVKKAESLWLVSRAMEAKGDKAEALRVSRQAENLTMSGRLRRDLRKRTDSLHPLPSPQE